MDTILLQLPFIIVVLYLIFKIKVATKRGAVKEICSFISMIVASVSVLLIAFALRKYFDQDRIVFVVTVILIFLIGVIYKVLETFLTTLKLIAKLPIVNLFDRLLGVVVAICEVVVFLWAVYCLIMIFDTGAVEEWIMKCVRENEVMKFFYRYNYLYVIIGKFSNKLASFDILGKLGIM